MTVSLNAFFPSWNRFLSICETWWAEIRCWCRRVSRKSSTWQNVMKITAKPIKTLLMNIKIILLKAIIICKIIVTSQAEPEAKSKREVVTVEEWAKGCLIASKRSQLSNAIWTIEFLLKQLIPALVIVSNKQIFPDSWVVGASSTVNNLAMKTGCTKSPIIMSVDASAASKMLDLWALSRFFIFTATMTKAFKTTMKGHERTLISMMMVRQDRARVDWWDASPESL